MLRPQDVILALYLVDSRPATQSEMAHAVGLSQPEISGALKRLQTSHLLLRDARSVIVPHLLEFCVHGVKYAYPPVIGRRQRGVPTAALVPPLLGHVSSEEGELVWPFPQGSARAATLDPIHSCAPKAARNVPKLHELLALLDGIRVGKSRMRQIAEEALTQRLLHKRGEG